MELIETKIENGLQLLDEKEASLIELREKFKGLKITGLEDKAGYKAVREARLILKDNRVQVQKDGKALRENAVKFQKRVIERENQLIEIIAETEDGLSEQEDNYNALVEQERTRKEREENERIQKRVDALAKYSHAHDLYDLKIMPEEDFQALLGEAQASFEIDQERIKQEKIKAEQERIAEQERLRVEREEMARIREDQEKREIALRAENERIQKEQRAREAELKAERDKLETEKRAMELEKAKAAAAEQARIETGNKIKREAEQKAERERLAKIESERQEALKPDKEKLNELAQAIKSIKFPDVQHEDSLKILGWIGSELVSLSDAIKSKSKNL